MIGICMFANTIISVVFYMLAICLFSLNVVEYRNNDFQWIVIYLLFAIHHNISSFGFMNMKD